MATILLPMRRTASMPSCMRSRCRPSSWNALTMRMPWEVSRMAPMMVETEWYWLSMALRMRWLSLRMATRHERPADQADGRHDRVLRHHHDRPGRRASWRRGRS